MFTLFVLKSTGKEEKIDEEMVEIHQHASVKYR